MRQVSSSDLRGHLKSSLDCVIDDREPMRIVRRNGTAAVLVAADDYEQLAETAYLLRSPQNARRLKEALRQAETRTGEEVDAHVVLHAPRP